MLTFFFQTYAYAVWRFIYYFLRPRSPEYSTLLTALKDDSVNVGRLIRLQKVMQKEFLTEQRIGEAVNQYPSIIKQIYAGELQ